MKLHALPLVLASVALAFAASTSSAQDKTTKPPADAAAATKAGKVAQAPPAKKPAAERVGTKPATPAAAQSSPAEDRRFQNCHGKESDA